ncbi:MAG: D-Ala-D-Ala carboxypeptidase family metallohydrolase [Bacteroidales bacterium]|nr:D-Ala-D-Ala carboxypeptidase family metallohydrolase [Bacteroidales bacterium]
MKYFTIDELCASDTARARGIDNTPSAEAVDNLTALVDNVLDPLREAWGAPIIVNSGYRCEALNDAIGGVNSSQHKTGQAADIVPKGRRRDEVRKLFRLVEVLGLDYDQLINEKDYTWVHVSYKKEGKNRRQSFGIE